MKLSLERNLESNRKSIPYHLNLEISSTAVVGYETKFQVPIFLEWIKGKNSYLAEICGFEMEAESPQSILNLAKKVAPTLVNFGQMPTYMFIARSSHKVYPVYTHGNEVIAITTPSGPMVRHVELAKIREYATSYLNKAGVLGKDGTLEKLHVRGVHQTTLGLIRPVFYLKKRPQNTDDNEFWAPVFQSDGNVSIYTYAVNEKREVYANNGNEVFEIRNIVAEALIGDNRLIENLDLRADRLLPSYWRAVEPTLTRLTSILAFDDSTLQMYRGKQELVAVEFRRKENRYSFYLGQTPEDLRLRAAKDLQRRGFISKLDEVTVIT